MYYFATTDQHMIPEGVLPVEQCGICFAMVTIEYLPKHLEWHENHKP